MASLSSLATQSPEVIRTTAARCFLLHRKITMKTAHRRFSILLLAAAALTSVVGCASTATQESTGQYLDDTAITARVKAAIFNDASLKSAEINVETFKGVVQLSGFVNSAADIQTAVRLVQGISGVRSVRNDMRLK
jgi:osmotically-inducible protein OsmY